MDKKGGTVRQPQILFLCTGNSARSQMAEAFMRRYAADHFSAFSAGLEPRGINPYTIRVMDEVGIDIRGQRCKNVKEYLGKEAFRYLITVCSHAEENCPTVWPGMQEKLYWPLDDPAAAAGSEEAILTVFRRVRDEIEAKVRELLAEQGVPVPG
jgi:arsenate reductase